jgi:hypothetical protein
MIKKEKLRLRVSNIYDYNASMMVFADREAEQIAKFYKETNKKHEKWRDLVQHQNDKKQKRAEMIIIKKYVCKWMTRRAYLKLLSATTFIKCC